MIRRLLPRKAVFPFAEASDIVPALDEAKTRGAQAINFLATPHQIVSRDLTLDHMSRISLPAIYQWPETPELVPGIRAG